jgi:hypothetical protein
METNIKRLIAVNKNKMKRNKIKNGKRTHNLNAENEKEKLPYFPRSFGCPTSPFTISSLKFDSTLE